MGRPNENGPVGGEAARTYDAFITRAAAPSGIRMAQRAFYSEGKKATMRRAFPTMTSNRAQQGVAGIRQAETPSTTYSPIFCVGLLLTIALVLSLAE